MGPSPNSCIVGSVSARAVCRHMALDRGLPGLSCRIGVISRRDPFGTVAARNTRQHISVGMIRHREVCVKVFPLGSGIIWAALICITGVGCIARA